MKAFTRGHTRGVAAVEFALLLPAFCFMMFGSVTVGEVLWTKFMLLTLAQNTAQVCAMQVNPVNGTNYNTLDGCATGVAASLLAYNSYQMCVEAAPDVVAAASGTPSGTVIKDWQTVGKKRNVMLNVVTASCHVSWIGGTYVGSTTSAFVKASGVYPFLGPPY